MLIVSYILKPRAVIGEHAVLISDCVTVGYPPGVVRPDQTWPVRLFVVVRQVEWLEERVGHALCGKVGAWAVAWDDLD